MKQTCGDVREDKYKGWISHTGFFFSPSLPVNITLKRFKISRFKSSLLPTCTRHTHDWNHADNICKVSCSKTQWSLITQPVCKFLWFFNKTFIYNFLVLILIPSPTHTCSPCWCPVRCHTAFGAGPPGPIMVSFPGSSIRVLIFKTVCRILTKSLLMPKS